MIRVLNILETMAFGGVERRRLSLAKHLDKSKFELKIICTHSNPEFVKQFEAEGVEIITIGNFNSPFHWAQHKKVQQIITEFKPHIIHGAVFEGVTMAAVNGCIKRVPIVILEETSDPQNRSWRGNLLMKLFTMLCDKVVGVSTASTDYLSNKLNIKKSKIALIENGVAIPRVVSQTEIEALRAKLNIGKDTIVIGSVGRMLSDSTKRFSDLIKAFNIIVQKDINAELILIGDGQEKENYIKLVAELGLSEKVHFRGYENDVAPYYELFDVFSLVSAHESFGLVLVEAMLHKLPVMATRVGGMQYIVDNDTTGFLVDKYNTAQMADKLELLCTNAALREKMGTAGYVKAMDCYTEEKYVARVSDLYNNLLESKKIR